MRARVSCAVIIAVGVWLSSPEASADAPMVESTEVDALFEAITDGERALEASIGAEVDCATACKAFASMQRAAERLCELDDGERCAAARAKVEAASKRLQAACPDCEAARETPKAPTRREDGEERPLDAEPAPAPEAQEVSPASAPPPESKRGSCAACTIGAEGDDETGLLAALGLLGLVLARRRRRTGRSLTAARGSGTTPSSPDTPPGARSPRRASSALRR